MFVACETIAKECARSYGKQKAETGGYTERYIKRYGFLAQQVGFGNHSRQRKSREKRNRKLCHNKNGGHGAELVIHREVVNHPVCKRREVVSPRKQHGKHHDQHKATADSSLGIEKRKNEKHTYKCSDIHGTGCSRLLAPILRKSRSASAKLRIKLLQSLHVLGIMGISLRFLVCSHRATGTAFDIRHKQGECFPYTVAPLSYIFL